MMTGGNKRAQLRICVAFLGVCGVLGWLSGHLPAADHTRDSVETIKKNLTEGKAVLVDVREVAETNDGYVKGARLTPLSQLKQNSDSADFAKSVAKSIPRDKVVYMYCRSGKRCLVATDVLLGLGYDARAVKLGYEDLAKEGFPVDKPRQAGQ